MTVSNTGSKVGPTTGDGSTTNFPYNRRLDDASHLVVVKTTIATGAETTLVNGVDYTITPISGGPPYLNGVNVTLTDAPTSAYTITRYRDTPVSQTESIGQLSLIPPATVEEVLDKCIMILQEMDNLLASTIQVSQGSSLLNPAINVIANYYLRGNSAGTAIESVSSTNPRIDVQIKTATYTVVTSDFANLIVMNGTSLTLNLTAAATLGAGFWVEIKNLNSTTLTIDAAGSETIDGAATKTLIQNESIKLTTDGTTWYRVNPLVGSGTITAIGAGRGCVTDTGGNITGSGNIYGNWVYSNPVVNTTAVGGDRGKFFVMGGTNLTLSLTAAATLTTGWYCAVRNVNATALTIDPNGAELIDGSATKTLNQNESCIIVCNGAQFFTMAHNPTVTVTQDWVKLSTKTASASSSIDFVAADGLNNATYSHYKIVFSNVAPATDNVNPYVRVSTDGGSTYANTAGDYQYAGRGSGSGTENAYLASASDTQMILCYGVGNDVSEQCSGEITFHALGDTAVHWSEWNMGMIGNTGIYWHYAGSGRYKGATTAVNGLRFLFSSGNIASGKFTLYGLKA